MSSAARIKTREFFMSAQVLVALDKSSAVCIYQGCILVQYGADWMCQH